MNRYRTLPIAVVATLLCEAVGAAGAQEPVRTRSGLISGTRVGDVAIYKGIPYAAPPVGALRWKPPQPAPHWDGVREATAFGPSCPQPPFPAAPFVKNWSEDCLTMDVWAPATTSARPMPVLVSIHGGGFFAGGSADPGTDGRILAERGVVVVSFNYRLGVFGFFAHPELSKESPTGTSGNYGLMDQIAALRWVRDNIAAFGGDPNNVTIFGSSAGGSSVLYLMLAPSARGLFARAISQSAALAYGPLGHVRERRYAQEPRETQGLRLGSDLATLRALSAQDLLSRAQTRIDIMFADADMLYWPVVDGAVLPDEPWVLFEAGRFARVPLIIGTTDGEGTLFAHFGRQFKTAEDWRAFLTSRHPGAEPDVLAAYPIASDADLFPAAARWVNDWFFHGTARGVARAVSAHGVPVYLYNFNRISPAQPAIRGQRTSALHSAEMLYLFGPPSPPPGTPDHFDEADRALGRAVKGAWIQFARTGDPNGAGLPEWPRYQTATDRHLNFGTGIDAGSGLHARSLDAFDRAFAKMRGAHRKADRP